MQAVSATFWNPMDASLESKGVGCRSTAAGHMVSYMSLATVKVRTMVKSAGIVSGLNSQAETGVDSVAQSSSNIQWKFLLVLFLGLPHTFSVSAGYIQQVISLPSKLASNTSSSEVFPDFQLGTSHSLARCAAHLTLRQLVWRVCVLIWFFWKTPGNSLEPSTKHHKHSITLMRRLLSGHSRLHSSAHNLLGRDSAA